VHQLEDTTIQAQLPVKGNLRHPPMPPEPCGLDVGCPLCGNRKVSLQHILSGCKVALAQGCFRCCHDQFLAKLAEVLESYRVAANHTAAKPFTSGFVKCGSMLQLPAQKRSTMLTQAKSGRCW